MKKNIVCIQINAARFQARHGRNVLPEQGMLVDGYLAEPQNNHVHYLITWPVNEATPFAVWAERIDLRHRGLHNVKYDRQAYLASLGEMPKVGHLISGDVLNPQIEGYFTVCSVQTAFQLLVEREDDLTLYPHLDEDDAGAVCGVDDITQYETEPADYSVYVEPDTMLEYQAMGAMPY